MKFGFRVPSLKKRIAARTSWKRVIRHNMGIKAPRGLGMVTNPKKAMYNKVYNKTTFGLKGARNPTAKTSSGNKGCLILLALPFWPILIVYFISKALIKRSKNQDSE